MAPYHIMGKGRAKRRSFKRQKDQTVSDGDDLPSEGKGRPVWNWRQKQQVHSFLTAYRLGCESVYAGKEPLSDEINQSPQIIGDVSFPAITADLCRRPYFRFPSTLSSAQRRLLHEYCAEVGLYHASTGVKKDRVVCISAYADGLTVEPKDTHSGTVQPLYKYRPWYYRPCPCDSAGGAKINGHNDTNPALRAIEHLIDQPGECLREGIDDMDFAAWDIADLSNCSAPPLDYTADTTCLLVDTPKKLTQCRSELIAANPTEIGFDLEAYNCSRNTQITCLIQITSNAEKTYVIDPLAPGVWDGIGETLGPFFSDPNIVKVGHAIGGLDVRCLHRDFGIHVVNAFDTFQAAQVLGRRFDSHGLAAVCQHYGMPESAIYRQLKTSYQNCDWRARPLTPSMIQYGRYDVHYLLRLRKLLMRDLTRGELWDKTLTEQRTENERLGEALACTLERFQQWEDGGEFEESEEITTSRQASSVCTSPRNNDTNHNTQAERVSIASVATLRLQADLMCVMSRSQQRCRDLWTDRKEVFVNHPVRVRYAQQARLKALDWTVRNDTLLELLVAWRDRTAKELGILSGFVAPLDFLLPVALHKPTSEASLFRISLDLPDVLVHEKACMAALLAVVRDFIASEGEKCPPERFLMHAQIGVASRKRKRLLWTATTLAITFSLALVLHKNATGGSRTKK